MSFLRWILLFAIGWLLFRLIKINLPRRKDTPPTEESMVRCEVCGVHIPLSEAHKVGSHTFCSIAHQKEHKDG